MGRRDRIKKRRAERSKLAQAKQAVLQQLMPEIGPTPETPAPVLLHAAGRAGGGTVADGAADGTARGPTGQFPPGVSGNPDARWEPGQSGNPAGHSRGRRFSSGLARLISEHNADGAICRVWLQEVLKGNFRFWAFMLDRIEGPVDYRNLVETPLPDEDYSVIDPKVIEAMLAAADPDNIPQFDDEDPAQEEWTVPSSPAAAKFQKPPDVSQADWLKRSKG
jgi:hypothetical protein